MKTIKFLLFASFIVVCFTFASTVQAANCQPLSGNWSQTTSTIGSNTELVISGGQNCAGKTAAIEMWEQGLNGKTGVTLSAVFDTSGPTSIIGKSTWTVSASGIDNSKRNQNSPWNDNYGFYFYVKIDGSSVTSNTMEVPIPYNIKTGGLNMTYGVTPTSVTAPGSATLKFTFKMHLDDPATFKNYCRSTPQSVSLYKSSSGAELPELSFSPPLGSINITTAKDYDFSYNRTDNWPAGLNQTGSYLGRIICGSRIVAESQPISFSTNTTGTAPGNKKYYCNTSNTCVEDTSGTQSPNYTTSNCDNKCSSGPGPSGNKIWACVADNGKYSCTPDTAANASNCSGGGNSACNGKQCVQIDSNLCSLTPGGGPQSYQYSITNPLNGGPESPFDIINIASRWLLNISIPLAVMFILYAGFLMLTAGPKPENVKKAKEIIWNVVLALAIIFIGRGFITLIKSVIELGGQSTPTTTGSKNIGEACVATSDCKTGLECDNVSKICKVPCDPTINDCGSINP